MAVTSYKGSSKRVLLATVTVVAGLAFMVYHLAVNLSTAAHGASGNVNVSVQVEPPICTTAPTIDDVMPLTGPSDGGTEATITGSNLNCVNEVMVSGNLKCQPITHIDNQSLRCVMPPHVEGYVNLTIVAPGYNPVTKTNGFRYLGSAISPTPPNGGGSGPLVPNTGLFRFGEQIVTLYEVLTLAAITLLGGAALWLMAWRQRRHEAGKPAES